MLQRIWCFIVFLTLTMEGPTTFDGHWSTPWAYTTTALLYPIPGIRIPVIDAIVLVLLVASRAQPGASTGRAKPMATWILVSMGTLTLWGIYGGLKGGTWFQIRFQLHTMMMVLISALMQMNLLRTPKHFYMVGKTIVYAALFRFVMMFVFYVTILRSLTVPLDTVTEHADSILFVTCFVIVLANALHERTRRASWRGGVVAVMMLWCIQTNNRRLAWVGLIGSLLIMYFQSQIGPLRRKINRVLIRIGPVVALYVAIGMSNPVGIFKPVASLVSVNDPNNPSTQSRILENIGLIVTLQTNPLFGTGFGQQYIEISTAFSVGDAIFPEYRYVPHNSVLGLLAFSGAFGFTGIWMVFAVTAFLNARAYAFATKPLIQTIAMTSVCEVIVHTNQMWGDLGSIATPGMVVISTAMAAASRMPVLTGAWPVGKRRA
ncbi:MAG: O-antigen ligase family protein [Polyangiaceae bacterium]